MGRFRAVEETERKSEELEEELEEEEEMASKSKVTMQKLWPCLLVVLLSSAIVCESASLIKRRTMPDYETDFEDEKVRHLQSNLTYNLISYSLI